MPFSRAGAPLVLSWLSQPAVLWILFARFLFDPVFYFYMFWIPQYLHRERQLSVDQIGSLVWIPFLVLGISQILGGRVSDELVKRGWRPVRARWLVLGAAAALTPASWLAAKAADTNTAIALMCVLMFAHGFWITNFLGLLGDVFPAAAIGTISGLTGTAGGIGGMLSSLAIGMVVDRVSFAPVFAVSGVLYPLAFAALLIATTGEPFMRMLSSSLCFFIAGAACCDAQDPDSARDWASLIGQRYESIRDIPYKNIGGFQAKVDIYTRYDRKPGPTMVYIHGGGWANGSKEQWNLWLLPYLQLGMRVVSVQYRLAKVAPAPAAVKDCRCALAWVFQNAAKYGFDPAKIAITGGSAGGHLILMTAFLRPSDGFDDECPQTKPGRSESHDRLLRPHRSGWRAGPKKQRHSGLVQGVDNPRELAARLSPLRYVRKGLPPVLIIHGDADEMVPYEDSIKLRDALTAAQVPNEFVSIPEGKHGRFQWSDADTIRVQRTIQAFFNRNQLTEPGSSVLKSK